MKMKEMLVKMSLKNLSINEEQRIVRDSSCRILSFCHLWWVVSSVHWIIVIIVVIFVEFFSNERTVDVSSGIITITNESNSLVCTVVCSFVGTSSLVVITVVQFLKTFTKSNSAELRSFLLITCILAPESLVTSNNCFTVSLRVNQCQSETYPYQSILIEVLHFVFWLALELV